MNRLLKLFVASASIFAVTSSALVSNVRPAAAVNTEYAETRPNLIRTVKLKDFGISMNIPLSYRAIRRTDGSVMIVSSDTYDAIRFKTPRGYTYLEITQSTDDSVYQHAINRSSVNPNVFLAYKQDTDDDGEFFLKVRTKTGIVEIRYNTGDLGLYGDELIDYLAPLYADVAMSLKID